MSYASNFKIMEKRILIQAQKLEGSRWCYVATLALTQTQPAKLHAGSTHEWHKGIDWLAALQLSTCVFFILKMKSWKPNVFTFFIFGRHVEGIICSAWANSKWRERNLAQAKRSFFDKLGKKSGNACWSKKPHAPKA